MDMTFLESCFLNLASRCKVQNFSKAFKSNFESRARCKLCVSWAPGFWHFRWLNLAFDPHPAPIAINCKAILILMGISYRFRLLGSQNHGFPRQCSGEPSHWQVEEVHRSKFQRHKEQWSRESRGGRTPAFPEAIECALQQVILWDERTGEAGGQNFCPFRCVIQCWWHPTDLILLSRRSCAPVVCQLKGRDRFSSPHRLQGDATGRTIPHPSNQPYEGE